MLRRIIWLTIGVTLGLALNAWIRRRLRDTVERYKPARLQADMSGAIRKLGDDVKGSMADGRDAMRAREALLKSRLEGASRN